MKLKTMKKKTIILCVVIFQYAKWENVFKIAQLENKI